MADTTPSRGLALALYGGTAVAALVGPTLARRLEPVLGSELGDLVATGGIVGAGFAAVALAERARPFRHEWNRTDGSELTDVLHLLVGGGIGLIAGDAAARPLRRALGRSPLARGVARLPLPARLAVSVVASDLFHTSIHRLVHRQPFLWQVHSVHHSARRLYSGNASRFHAVQAALVVAGDNVVLAAIGLDPRTTVAHRIVRGIFGQVQHANVSVDSGWWNRILSTPEKHRWHHSVDPAEADTNYASVVCLWDQVFGTDRLPEVEMTGPIGVAGVADYPQDFRSQCVAPFRWAELTAP